MTPPFSDDLISAYLDGELTPDQQALVEQQLSQRADLRRLCAELRLLRRTLQAMPVAAPPDNLAERVLRQAERRMLTGDPTGEAPPLPAVDWAGPARRPPARRHVRAWPVAAAVAVVAATGLVMIVWPRNAARDVAQAPTARPESRSTPRSDDEYGAKASDAHPAGDGAETWSAIRDAPAREPAPALPAPALPALASPSDLSEMNGTGAVGGQLRSGAAAGGAGSPDLSAPRPAADDTLATPGRLDSITPHRRGLGGLGRHRLATPGRLDSITPSAAPDGTVTKDGRMAAGAPAMAAPTASKERGAATAPGAIGAGPRAGDRAEALAVQADAKAGGRAAQEVVDQIVSQLNQDQILLVRVQLPERELSAALVELSSVHRTNLLTASGSIVPVEQMQMANGEADARAPDLSSRLQVPARNATELRQLQLELTMPSTVIVDGSSEQIRQSLSDLSTRHDVDLQPVTLDPTADRRGLAARSAVTPEAAAEREGAARATPPSPAVLDKSTERVESLVPPRASRRAAQQSDLPDSQPTMFYLLLRLWTEPAADRPAQPTPPAHNP